MLADAGKDIEHFTPERGGMLHAVGREEREAMLFRQVDQLAVDSFLAPDEMALQLDVNALPAKDIKQLLRVVSKVPIPGRTD